VKLVIAGEAVPAGHYTRLVIRNLSRAPGFDGDFAPRTLRNVVSEEDNVKSVVSKVQLVEADAGFVYRSDITPAVARYLRIIEIPQSANVIASYPIALTKNGPAPDAAKAFVDLVLSAEGQRVLQQYGLMPVAANTP
jgi:molybdate transport system substrate-binding protein